MYKKDYLRKYIRSSELRVFSNNIKVRLSKELTEKYDQGNYENSLNFIDKCFAMISKLNIKYPGNANPSLYIYIVPDENYQKLLNFPEKFALGKDAGKPVICYDLDGFNNAYWLSQNKLKNKSFENITIAKIENEIHELAHVIHSQFFSKNQTICEGFAEMLPLHGLGLEDVFEEHKNILNSLDSSKILTAKELLNSENNGSYGNEQLLPGGTCSFRLSYISSYLLVRGCVEQIVATYSCSKESAIQLFLEIVKTSIYWGESLIYDMADAIEFSRESLLNGKELQLKVLEKLSLNSIKR